MLFASCRNNVVLPEDKTPPTQVTNIKAVAGNGSVSLFWTNPADNDFFGTRITFEPAVQGIAQPVIIEGDCSENSNTIINGLNNGTEYTFTLIALDKTQNMANAVSIIAIPKDTVSSNESNENNENKEDSENSETNEISENNENNNQIGDNETDDVIYQSNISDFKILSYSDYIELIWANPSDSDFSAVEISCDPAEGRFSKPVVIPGKPSERNSCSVKNLDSDKEYKFTIKAIYRGNVKSKGISQIFSLKQCNISLEVSLPNDNNGNITLSKDNAPITVHVTTTDAITEVLWKKVEVYSVKDFLALFTDENVQSLQTESNNISLSVTENGFYDIVVKTASGQVEGTRVEIKTIDKKPLSEVSQLNASCDDDFVYLTWKNPVSANVYDSPLKNLRISYIFDDEASESNEVIISDPRIENYSILIPEAKKNSSQLQITINTVDELENISEGFSIKVYLYDVVYYTMEEYYKIEYLTKSVKVVITGEWNNGSYSGLINRSLKKLYSSNPEIKVYLDLSLITGLTIFRSSFVDNCQNIVGFKLPDTIETIEREAFAGCTSLTNIVIPDRVTSIQSDAFQGCTSLTAISIPDSVTTIYSKAFKDCANLEDVTLSNSLTRIDSDLFYNCINLRTITIPASVSYISSRAFQNCNITSITIPANEMIISRDAFEDCQVNIINYTGSLEQWFSKKWDPGCVSASYDLYISGQKISNLIIPENLTTIEEYAFRNCSSLKSVKMTENCEILCESAFRGCINLDIIYIYGNVDIYIYMRFLIVL